MLQLINCYYTSLCLLVRKLFWYIIYYFSNSNFEEIKRLVKIITSKTKPKLKHNLLLNTKSRSDRACGVTYYVLEILSTQPVQLSMIWTDPFKEKRWRIYLILTLCM